MAKDSETPERPRVEPEIIPPDRTSREPQWRPYAWRPYASDQANATHRIYIARVGPLGAALLLFLVVLAVAIALLAVLGAVLIWIPVLALLVVAGALLRILRR
jgi:hypothetical protein